MRQRSYDKEFIKSALELYKNGKPGTDICNDLGIAYSTFWGWLKKYKVEGPESFTGSGHTKPVNEEAVRLKRELEDVKAERDILKKALAIFSRQKP
jgi:transposase